MSQATLNTQTTILSRALSAVAEPMSAEFKSSFSTLTAFILGWTIPTGISITLIIEGVSTGSVLGALIASAGAALAQLGCTAIAVAYFKVYVRIDRLRGYNAMGTYFEFPWADIEAIRPINFGGLRYTRIASKNDNRVMWLPLFLNHMKEFHKLVVQYTEPGNPLAQYLNDNLT